MSRIRPTKWEQKVLGIACPTCSAKPETWCKTNSDRWASVLHNLRWLLFWAKEKDGK